MSQLKFLISVFCDLNCFFSEIIKITYMFISANSAEVVFQRCSVEEVFCRRGVLRNSAKFTRKYLQSLFLWTIYSNQKLLTSQIHSSEIFWIKRRQREDPESQKVIKRKIRHGRFWKIIIYIKFTHRVRIVGTCAKTYQYYVVSKNSSFRMR